MKNALAAKLFYEIGDMLEIEGVAWKPNAYRRAAQTIEGLREDIEAIYAKGGTKALKELPGIGDALAKKLEEIIKTGELSYYEKLKKELPIDFETLNSIPGLGPKKIKKLYDELKVRKLEDLKKAVEAGKIRKLEGFGEKSEQDIAKGIALLERTKGRALLGFALREARALVDELKKSRAVGKIEIAGSLRRRKETIGDIDILVTSKKPEEVMELFVKLEEVEDIIAKGETKTSVRLRNGLACDLRVLPEESFGSALQYFTGSKEHNVALRRLAIEKKFKLSEYGLFGKNEKRIAGKSEEEIYRSLGLQYIPPELRENTGEIDAAAKGKLPKLVELKDIRGDLHCHTSWSDGNTPLAEMVAAVKAMGYEYMAITDHTTQVAIANSLDERRLAKQAEEISKLKLGEFTVLRGTETDITADGILFMRREVLKKLDIVIGSIHTRWNMPKDEMTKRIVRAIESGSMHIFGHPSGRLIGEREAYQFDFSAVLDAAKENNVFIEVNSHQKRLDARDVDVREGIAKGVKFAIDTDSHSPQMLSSMELGVATARRGWAEKKDILNARNLEELGKLLAR